MPTEGNKGKKRKAKSMRRAWNESEWRQSDTGELEGQTRYALWGQQETEVSSQIFSLPIQVKTVQQQPCPVVSVLLKSSQRRALHEQAEWPPWHFQCQQHSFTRNRNSLQKGEGYLNSFHHFGRKNESSDISFLLVITRRLFHLHGRGGGLSQLQRQKNSGRF